MQECQAGSSRDYCFLQGLLGDFPGVSVVDYEAVPRSQSGVDLHDCVN